MAMLPCGLGPSVPNGMARRYCNPNTSQWNSVSLDECFTSEPRTVTILNNIIFNYSLFSCVNNVGDQQPDTDGKLS